ncbi:MAG: branched-chain alpha-keto acid dehydrogenase subunit E2 [Gammaproteobacteria bacterium RIFCSPHIGHO2_12_FULL_41_20]|nr:MAG: branched-chain alpha-keto acid dehydrogenase subunit E2 [Gammaproteobacteria bacterium RIFCSPHIGHO2_12_FULL_41_20]
MNIFNLPDLGEGLADAEIREWYVKEGDTVKVDQPLVSMETAKAVVDVPSPQAGRIIKLYGTVNQIIKTGAPLIGFESESVQSSPIVKKAGGSVVGALEESEHSLNEDEVVVGVAVPAAVKTPRVLPAIRALAKQLHVDLEMIIPTGPQGQITAEDVQRASQGGKQHMGESQMEELRGVRRAMAQIMAQSHSEVTPVTIVEDADLTDLSADIDMTVHLLQAVVAGVKAEPALNAWFDGKSLKRRVFSEVHIGLAVDTPEGLFVPVIKGAEALSASKLRAKVNAFKKEVTSRTVAPIDLHGATISLSNFGTITGRYASPIIVPPAVAILGCGRAREVPAVHKGKVAIRRILPLSLTFDHRAATGGEAARFLAAVIQYLEGL